MCSPEQSFLSLVLTVWVDVLTQLRLGLSVGPVTGLVGESGRHGSGSDDGFEGTFPLLHVEFRVEDDDVDFGHVEHPEGHRRTQVHGDGQCGRLDVQLGGDRKNKGELEVKVNSYSDAHNDFDQRNSSSVKLRN